MNPKNGRHFGYFDTAHDGYGGSIHGDGVGPYKTIRHADNKDIPVEVQEALYPVRVERHEWRVDSAGAGRHRGGLGVDKTFVMLADVTNNLAYERYQCPPWGLLGGAPGDPGYAEHEPAGGQKRKLHKISGLKLKPGDRIHIHTGAGGGYGLPAERDPEAVREDVAKGYVSTAQAREVYRVVIDANLRVDVAATAALRQAA